MNVANVWYRDVYNVWCINVRDAWCINVRDHGAMMCVCINMLCGVSYIHLVKNMYFVEHF